MNKRGISWFIVGLLVVLVAVAAVTGANFIGRENSKATVWASDEETKARLAENGAGANLPAVFRADNTPTPTIAPTPTDDAFIYPTPPPTAIPNPSPTPGFSQNWLVNGSFEGDQNWTNLPPVEGNLINQEPNGWKLDWLDKNETVWDLRTIHPEDPLVGVVSGIAEMLHKQANQLPPEEQPGGPKALILHGTQVYKMFHHGAAFGSQLSQAVTLPAGKWRLTVPVQLHWHEALDPADPNWDTFTAESGAWVLYGGAEIGGWATAREMGDQRWFYHVIEFTLPAETNVEVLIRVKSIYKSAKDFFIDAVWLQPVN